MPAVLSSVALSQIVPSSLNPRKRFDQGPLEELAASIRVNGLLQPLVLRPHPERVGAFEIVAGERRFRALRLLRERGLIPADFAVPHVVRDVDDDEMLVLAASENVSREDMSVLEEASAFGDLLARGLSVEEVAARFGVSVRTVERRVALVSALSSEVQAALDAGEVSLGHAQVLTVVPVGEQGRWLERIRTWKLTPEALRSQVGAERVPVSRALFGEDAYVAAGGTVVRDLFSEAGEGFFEDTELFRRLQEEALEGKRVELAARFGVVRVVRHFQSWNFEAGDGAVLELRHDYSVLVHEGVVEKAPVQPVGAAAARVGARSGSEESVAPVSLDAQRARQFRATRVTRVLMERVAQDARLGKALAALLLAGLPGFDASLEDAGAQHKGGKTNDAKSALLQELFDGDREAFNLVGVDANAAGVPNPFALRLKANREGVLQLLGVLLAMPDAELDGLLGRLAAVRITHPKDDAAYGTALRAGLAARLGLTLEDVLDPAGESYLQAFGKEELERIARHVGAKASGGKAELVRELAGRADVREALVFDAAPPTPA